MRNLIHHRCRLLPAVAALCIAGLLAACLPPQPTTLPATATLRPTSTVTLPPATATKPATAPAAGQPTIDAQTRKRIMDTLIPQVRHWKGDAGAPVTIIEFSDFQ